MRSLRNYILNKSFITYFLVFLCVNYFKLHWNICRQVLFTLFFRGQAILKFLFNFFLTMVVAFAKKSETCVIKPIGKYFTPWLKYLKLRRYLVHYSTIILVFLVIGIWIVLKFMLMIIIINFTVSIGLPQVNKMEKQKEH